MKIYKDLSVQEVYDELISYTSEAINKFIPTLDMSKIKKSTAPWVKGDLKTLIRKKKNLRYRNCACNWKDTNLCKEYRQICRSVKLEVKNARLVYEVNLVEKSKIISKTTLQILCKQPECCQGFHKSVKKIQW